MSIEQKINGDVGTLILGEEIDLDSSPTVRENIKDLLTSTKIVEVNLANVSYIDSSGIASLIEGMQMAKQQTGKEFHLVCLLYTSPSPRDATLSRMPSSA